MSTAQSRSHPAHAWRASLILNRQQWQAVEDDAAMRAARRGLRREDFPASLWLDLKLELAAGRYAEHDGIRYVALACADAILSTAAAMIRHNRRT